MSQPTNPVAVGSTIKLTATVVYTNSTQVYATPVITWKSTDTDIATISNGIVTGVKAGTVAIMAINSDGSIGLCTVKVSAWLQE